jgi:putative ATPase
VRSVIGRAEERRRATNQPTIFFLDEIHRFNKAQQDALLPAVEEGLLTLIGATTENPYFEVNSALLSRSQMYELRALGPADVRRVMDRALADPERGIADPPEIADDAMELLATRSGGDARIALAALERAVETARAGNHPVDLATAEDALQRKAVSFDREGDQHYDYISAWIKATRGSDPDASLYYLAVMLEGGEDPRFIARRMVILASEDVGNADPQALVVATAAAQAVDRVGLPECQLNLAQAAVYLAMAPKSNASMRGLSVAKRHVREHGAKPPPDYLRDSHYPGAKKLGRGEGYVYPHDRPGGVAEQPLLPVEVQDQRFYEPTERGFEAELARRLEELRRRLSG